MIHRLAGTKMAKLQPGDLDAEIDRKVMNLDRSAELPVPKYSTTWAHAFEVVDQLSPSWAFSMVVVGEQVFVTFMERMPLVQGKSREVKATGINNGPQVICMAALNVVGALS